MPAMWRRLAMAMVLSAAPVAARTLDEYGLVMPPERFASGPTLWPVIIHKLSDADLAKACSNIAPVGPYGRAAPGLGCTTIGPPTCDIYTRENPPVAVILSEHVMEHEMA